MGLLDSCVGTYLPIDPSIGALQTVLEVDSLVNRGLRFSTQFYQTGASVVSVLITADSTNIVKLSFDVQTTGPGTTLYSKTPNTTATRSNLLISYNINEQSSNTASLVLRSSPTIVSAGTSIHQALIGATTGSPGNTTFLGGSAAFNAGYTLGLSSVHLITFTPTASCETIITVYHSRLGV